MRQAGFLAAAAHYALRNNVERLASDHDNARTLASLLGSTISPAIPPTNIVMLVAPAGVSAEHIEGRAKELGVRLNATGPTTLRAVTHLDVSEADVREASEILLRVFDEASR